jgi:L-lactate dehydrogenase complex protein LldG
MTDRDQILNAIVAHQPTYSALPQNFISAGDNNDLITQFTETLTAIGGTVQTVDNTDAINEYIKSKSITGQRVISRIVSVTGHIEEAEVSLLPHELQNVHFAILQAHFGVAENGAVWITEELMGQRVLPFICQHLIIALHAKDIVADMHEAYKRIGTNLFGFGTFIAGPSKTADIEQSLVLGAHGSRTMTVFLIRS